MGCTLCTEENRDEKVSQDSDKRRAQAISLYSFGFVNDIDTPTQTSRSNETHSSSSLDSFLNDGYTDHYQTAINSQARSHNQQRQSYGQYTAFDPDQIPDRNYRVSPKQETEMDRYNFSENYYERNINEDE